MCRRGIAECERYLGSGAESGQFRNHRRPARQCRHPARRRRRGRRVCTARFRGNAQRSADPRRQWPHRMEPGCLQVRGRPGTRHRQPQLVASRRAAGAERLVRGDRRRVASARVRRFEHDRDRGQDRVDPGRSADLEGSRRRRAGAGRCPAWQTPGLGRDLQSQPWRPLWRGARRDRREGRRRWQSRGDRPCAVHGRGGVRKHHGRGGDGPPRKLSVRHRAYPRRARPDDQRDRPRAVGGDHHPDRADRHDFENRRDAHRRWRCAGIPDRLRHRSTIGDERVDRAGANLPRRRDRDLHIPQHPHPAGSKSARCPCLGGNARRGGPALCVQKRHDDRQPLLAALRPG